MSIPEPTSYDVLPYDSHPFERTHPDNLATIARLFGVETPRVRTARVLELGCASGGNLVPMAVALPEATFVGVDLSGRQIEQGRGLVGELGLTNLELRHASIADLGPNDGPFDYILCHGVYSWVPPDVQEAILRVCRENLVPSGVAYVSYNTYPGWFMRGMVRQMMCFHARQFDEPQIQVQQARALLDFLIEAGPAGDETYHHLLRRELEILRDRQDSYLFHEHLEENNAPTFFYEFVERAERHDLRYLGEAQFGEMVAANVSPIAERTLRELGAGLVHSEQYLDFLRNRTFRRTLLCQKEAQLDREVGPARLRGMYVAADLAPTSTKPNLRTTGDESFRSGSGLSVTLSHPLSKTVLAALHEAYPRAIRFEDLPAFAETRHETALVRDAKSFEAELEQLGCFVLDLYSKDLIELRCDPPHHPTAAGDLCTASPLVRLQAERGEHASNLRHEVLPLTDLERHVVRQLDGTRDRAAVTEAVVGLVVDGTLVVERFGQRLADRATALPVVREIVGRTLDRLAAKGMLIAVDGAAPSSGAS